MYRYHERNGFLKQDAAGNETVTNIRLCPQPRQNQQPLRSNAATAFPFSRTGTYHEPSFFIRTSSKTAYYCKKETVH